MADPIWSPSPERIARTRLRQFMDQAGVTDYASLHRWSVDCPEAFWDTLRHFVGLKLHREPERTVDRFERMPGAAWFPGSSLNFAENLLHEHGSREALVAWNEKGRQRSLSGRELLLEVGALAGSLEAAGVRAGDRVAGVLPNVPEAVAAMLAATSLGAAWSACSPDFGADAIVGRLGPIRPKVLFAADNCVHAGRTFECLDRVREIALRVDSIERIVIVEAGEQGSGSDTIPNAIPYRNFRGPSAEPRFASFPFDHPAYILFSSGTTGAPKCIVHGAGGTLLQHLKELVLHADLGPGDRICYLTTCGWMMWQWLVSSLAVGATVVLYDGSPLHPCAGRAFDMAERERLTVLGTSAKHIAAIEKLGVAPAASHDLSSLRTILSTGSPLAPESFDYVYGKIKPDVCLASISGGTDIISCFALGNPAGPVYRGELQVPGLGMRVEVFDPHGRPLPPGAKGELVCTQPFPSMPVGFWDDPGGLRYREAYFERYPDVWHHGDFCERTASGGFRIWGRSDATLNPGGVRVGTAEIYAAVESMPEVAEAVAVGWEVPGDEEVALFVRLTGGATLDEELAGRIRQRIRASASPRHVPKRVMHVADIPRTRNGKIAEIAVKRSLHGQPIENRDALANPEALDAFRALRERA